MQEDFWNKICTDTQHKKYLWFDQGEIIPIRTLFEIFLKKGIYLDGFVSDDEGCTGIYLLNKNIFSVDEIDIKNSYIFSDKKIEKYSQIQNVPKDECPGNVFIDEKECFGIQNIGWMREIARDKKLFIFGLSDRSKKLASLYKLLDFRVEGHIDDGKLDEKAIPLEDIIYEENFFLLISREAYRDKAERLADLGLLMFEHMGIDNPFGTWYLGTGNQILDINLGHSFQGKQGMCGFEVYGENNLDDMRIFVLGGSTTDGSVFPFKSWPQFLADKMSTEKVTVFNGGVVGYTSTQELIKLLRDVLFMKPDIVIVYDGFNDMTSPSAFGPFAFKELQDAMNYVDRGKDKLWLDLFAEDVAPYTGVNPDMDKYEIWLSNMNKMWAVCETQEVSFFSFLQPVLYSKANRTKEENGLLWSTWRLNHCYEWANEFRSRIRTVGDSAVHIHDLSHLFDSENGIYMDDCHVYERGNEIIADSIYEVIKGKLKQENQHK